MTTNDVRRGNDSEANDFIFVEINYNWPLKGLGRKNSGNLFLFLHLI